MIIINGIIRSSIGLVCGAHCMIDHVMNKRMKGMVRLRVFKLTESLLKLIFPMICPMNLPESAIIGRAIFTNSQGIFSLATVYRMKVVMNQ